MTFMPAATLTRVNGRQLADLGLDLALAHDARALGRRGAGAAPGEAGDEERATARR